MKYLLKQKNATVNTTTIKIMKYTALGFFSLSLLCHFYLTTLGWHNPIYDHHGFRQTTTAISVFYMLRDGLQISYPLPIFGAPWSIPLEFPIYQWLVVVLAKHFGCSIEQAGRTISLASFYLCLVPLYKILSMFVKKVEHRLIVLCFFLTSPIYIFWSRTFMIETLALCFSLCFVAICADVLKQQNNNWKLIPICIVGSIAGLAKVTTFLISCVFVFCLLIGYGFFDRSIRFKKKHLLKQLLYTATIFFIPILVVYLWAKYTDTLKAQNPLTRGFLDFNFYKTWMFGSFTQRLSLDTWTRMFNFSVQTMGSEWLLLLLLFGIILIFALYSKMSSPILRLYGWLSIICFVSYLSGPLVFTNVYLLHDYYQCASGIFLILSFGFVLLLALSFPNWEKIIYYGMIPVLIASLFVGYLENKYYKIQQWRGYSEHPSVAIIKKVLPQDSVLLIYGMDHDPSFAYYSQRRAIMDPKDRPLTSPSMQESIQKTGRHLIRAMLVMGKSRRNNTTFVQERVRFFQFHPKPLFRGEGVDLYTVPLTQIKFTGYGGAYAPEIGRIEKKAWGRAKY